MTTTSCMVLTDVDNVKFNSFRLSNGISCWVNPTELITRVDVPEGALIWKVPSAVVTVVVVDPFTCTDTPARGFPASSVILPVTGKVCASEISVDDNNSEIKKILRQRGVRFSI